MRLLREGCSDTCWTAIALGLSYVAANLIVFAVAAWGGSVNDAAYLVHKATTIVMAAISASAIVTQLPIRGNGRRLVYAATVVTLVVLFGFLIWLWVMAAVLVVVFVAGNIRRRREADELSC